MTSNVINTITMIISIYQDPSPPKPNRLFFWSSQLYTNCVKCSSKLVFSCFDNLGKFTSCFLTIINKRLLFSRERERTKGVKKPIQKSSKVILCVAVVIIVTWHVAQCAYWHINWLFTAYPSYHVCCTQTKRNSRDLLFFHTLTLFLFY